MKIPLTKEWYQSFDDFKKKGEVSKKIKEELMKNGSADMLLKFKIAKNEQRIAKIKMYDYMRIHQQDFLSKVA